MIVSNPNRKHHPPEWSENHELVANMRALWEIVKDDPIGPVVRRIWHIGWRTHTTKPDTFRTWDDGYDDKADPASSEVVDEITRRDGSEVGLGRLAP